eukprot:9133550-Pyramimonas_sp.AAC.1
MTVVATPISLGNQASAHAATKLPIDNLATSAIRLRWNAASLEVAPALAPQETVAPCLCSHALDNGRRSRLQIRTSALISAIRRWPPGTFGSPTRTASSRAPGQKQRPSHLTKAPPSPGGRCLRPPGGHVAGC